MRPSWVMVRSVVVTPDMSTGVCDCSPVRISWGFGWGSSQNGLLSLSMSAGNDRICGSILGFGGGVGGRLGNIRYHLNA